MHLHFKRDSIAKLNLHLVIFWVSLDMTRDCVSWRIRRKEKNLVGKKKRCVFEHEVAFENKYGHYIIWKGFQDHSEWMSNCSRDSGLESKWVQFSIFIFFFKKKKCLNFQFLAVKIFQIRIKSCLKIQVHTQLTKNYHQNLDCN